MEKRQMMKTENNTYIQYNMPEEIRFEGILQGKKQCSVYHHNCRSKLNKVALYYLVCWSSINK